MEKVIVGIMGCGEIFPAYVRRLKGRLSGPLEIKACADLMPEKAKRRAEEFGIPVACGADALLSDSDIQMVVNLTPIPAHYESSMAILEAGKHLFSEKPLANRRDDGRRILEGAAKRGLRVGGAADTFLGAGLQACRRLIDEGAIGVPITAQAFLTITVKAGFHYFADAGPMHNMGPYYLAALFALLGPTTGMSGSATVPFPEKISASGETFAVETPSTLSGVLDFASGCAGSITITYDGIGYLPRLEFYGSEGVLYANDPNAYAGPVTLLTKDGARHAVPLMGYADGDRGLGVAEMAHAIRMNRDPRASGDLMMHVLDNLLAIRESSESGRRIAMESSLDRPEPFDPAEILAE
jgi:predicted dehydrogenase